VSTSLTTRLAVPRIPVSTVTITDANAQSGFLVQREEVGSLS
jgi:hypothetical protein